MSNKHEAASGDLIEYVTVMITDQLFGLPIGRVQDVFMLDRMTRVPLSAPEIAGVLNLRGRIVTAVDMRRRLGLPDRDESKPPMAIGIDSKGESYGLIIDSVGEVLKLVDSDIEPNPVNLDAGLARIAAGVYRLDGQLLVVLDVDRILDMGHEALAA